MSIRLYSLHELIAILRRAGWSIFESVHNIRERTKVRYDSPINIIARK